MDAVTATVARRLAPVLLVLTLLATLLAAPPPARASDGVPPAGAAATDAPLHVRLNVGGPRLEGDPVWQADGRGSESPWLSSAGTRHSRTAGHLAVHAGSGDAPAELYRTSRLDLGRRGDGGELRFAMPVESGRYEVRLHLAETHGNGFSRGARVFDVAAEGRVVLDDVDVFATAGPRRGSVQAFHVDVDTRDARLDLEFRHGPAGHPRVNGIEVIEVAGRSPTATGAPVLHVTPHGAGEEDGSGWDDATDLYGLPELLDFAAPGTEVWLHAGLGPYHVDRPVPVRAGGAPGSPVVVRGTDAAGRSARALLVGTRTSPYDPDGERGSEVFRLLSGADHLAFRDLDFRDVGNGAFRIGADITDLSLVGMRATNVRRFVENVASGTETTASVTGLLVRDVRVHGFSRGAVRLRYASNDVHLVDVVGDSQRQDHDRFAIGVHLSGLVHDVLVERVTMRNAHDTVTHANDYWNGDGFATENGVRDVVFRDTVATGNTDAGYDLKSASTLLVRAHASDNKRNFRLWYDGVRLEDCTGRDPRRRGGIGSQAQVFLARGASARVVGCMFADADDETIVYDLSQDATLEVRRTRQRHAPLAELARVQEGGALTFS